MFEPLEGILGERLQIGNQQIIPHVVFDNRRTAHDPNEAGEIRIKEALIASIDGRLFTTYRNEIGSIGISEFEHELLANNSVLDRTNDIRNRLDVLKATYHIGA